MSSRLTGIVAIALLGAVLRACSPRGGEAPSPPAARDYESLRRRMVAEQIAARGVRDRRVLEAMRKVRREEFVPPDLRPHAYEDRPLPIGFGQTISQPYIVAFMTEKLRLAGGEKVLEIGTGSGYQAAVLAELGAEVYTMEIIPELAGRAESTLRRLGYADVHVKTGDGYAGWPEHAPFDAIILTCAPPDVPKPLIDQLAPGGRLIAPVGEAFQELVLLHKTDRGIRRESVLPVRFVPMVGEAQKMR